MGQRTEAACLLETGALYRQRIGLQPHDDGAPIFAGFKTGAFSLYFGDAPIYHFDLEGRWQRAFEDGRHYLKGLDAEVHAIDRVREGPNLVLHRRKLSGGEACDLDARIRSVALELMDGLADGRFARSDPPEARARPLPDDELHHFLERISRWDAAAWFAHRERYTATYGPLPFVPPECQNALVLQATLGHADGQTFGLSRPEEAYVRNVEEFARHIDEVARLWGRRRLQSRLIFLAGDDVLRQPLERVESFLDEIRRVFPIGREETASEIGFEGVHAFLDDFLNLRVNRQVWSRLRERGLSRVSLGVESGNADVRMLHGKHWAGAELRWAVGEIKAAGLGVSILTLVGAGGVERARDHVECTARLIEALDLAPGDFVFLLDENEIRGPGRQPAGLAPLSGDGWSDQQRRLRDALGSLKGRSIKVLPYTIEKQWT